MKKINAINSLSKSKDSIGRFFFCVSPSFRDSITGHAWIAVINDSDFAIEVGNYKVDPGEYVSLGLFGPIRRIKVGLFYNMESKEQNGKHFIKNIGVYHNFTRENLEKLNEYLNSLNPKSYRLITNNCCHFAVRAWNFLYGDEYSFKIRFDPYSLCQELLFSIKYDFLPGIRDILFDNEKIRHYLKKEWKLLFQLQKIRKKSPKTFPSNAFGVFNTYFPSLYIGYNSNVVLTNISISFIIRCVRRFDLMKDYEGLWWIMK